MTERDDGRGGAHTDVVSPVLPYFVLRTYGATPGVAGRELACKDRPCSGCHHWHGACAGCSPRGGRCLPRALESSWFIARNEWLLLHFARMRWQGPWKNQTQVTYSAHTVRGEGPRGRPSAAPLGLDQGIAHTRPRIRLSKHDLVLVRPRCNTRPSSRCRQRSSCPETIDDLEAEMTPSNTTLALCPPSGPSAA